MQRIAVRLLQGLCDKADSKQRLFGFVQELHLPFGVLFQLARNTADQTAANAGQLFLCSIAVG